MLHIKLNRRQYNALEGLAYWIADAHYLRERYGAEEPELQIARDSIRTMFNELDALQVPFWVQNTVIAWAEDWRRYKTDNMMSALKRRSIDF